MIELYIYIDLWIHYVRLEYCKINSMSQPACFFGCGQPIVITQMAPSQEPGFKNERGGHGAM